MSDIEKVKACAEMMEFEYSVLENRAGLAQAVEVRDETGLWVSYDPLHDDAQAMALVKRLGLTIIRTAQSGFSIDGWLVAPQKNRRHSVESTNLNHAIVECVYFLPRKAP